MTVDEVCDLQMNLTCGPSLVLPEVCLHQVFPGSWHLAKRIKEVHINSKSARGFNSETVVKHKGGMLQEASGL